ncbi:Endonuclease, Uma2 family [Nostoc flagelliforme CCNUN1]|uniref:Endonuclease, Uma2 family n=1 Tax=Nostoc flagelliforme CCNUN1 TaxID=2038116 RepID=A0A2K8T532_9NOSO|nr:Endonuclease, Uma2 family [Nostoc flagelliforme CCNUN1]
MVLKSLVVLSYTFPNLPIVEVISRFVEQSRTLGRSLRLRAFRQWVRKQIIQT